MKLKMILLAASVALLTACSESGVPANTDDEQSEPITSTTEKTQETEESAETTTEKPPAEPASARFTFKSYEDESFGISLSITGSTGLSGDISVPEEIGGYTVRKISTRAFRDNTEITSVTIPNTVTEIEYAAFKGCTGLTSIAVENNNASYASVDGVLFDKSITTLVQYPIGRQDAAYSIPDSVTEIFEFAFSGSVNLTSVTIPNSVTTFGQYAFEGCSGLMDITIPSSVTKIGTCTFSECTGLTSVIIPYSVDTLGKYVFESCTGLTFIEVEENNENYTSIDGVLVDKNAVQLMQYPIGRQDAEYSIPDGVASISSFAFYGCTSLTSVTIPSSMAEIGSYAFYHFYGLTSITIPDSVTKLGESAFDGCENLTSVIIPDSVIDIDVDVFRNCPVVTIQCHSGSAAEQYAIKNDIPYTTI